MINKIFFLLQILIIYLLPINVVLADLQKNLINKITATQTLSFNFTQKIEGKEEFGKCIIKYPLLMKCDYENVKQKSLIANGKTVAIIKKKYKKIYYYPIKKTPLFFILQKQKILYLIRNSVPKNINTNLIKFEIVDKKSNKLKIIFEEDSLEFKGWETTDAYLNNVSFIINDLEVNKVIDDTLFKIPKEKDL